MTTIRYTKQTDQPFHGAKDICEFKTRMLPRSDLTYRVYIRRLTGNVWETVTRDVTGSAIFQQINQQREAFIKRMEALGWERN